MQVQQLWGVSTRVVMWIAGDQEVGIDATGVGTDMARVTVSWEVAQIHFTAADQVVYLAGQMRDITGVSAVCRLGCTPEAFTGGLIRSVRCRWPW